MRGDGRNMGKTAGVGRRAEGLFGARGAVRAARPRCDSCPPVSFSLKGALRFRRFHPALALGVCLISPCIVSRPAAVGVSSHYRRLLLHTRIFEGEASSCSANHGSGGEGWLPRQTRNVPAPRPRTAPARGEGSEQRRRRVLLMYTVH